MNTLKLKLNPYKDINIASLDDKPLSPYSELNNYMKEPFLSWVSKLLEAAEREINDDYCLEVVSESFEALFLEGMQNDFDSCKEYRTASFQVNTSTSERFDLIRKLASKYAINYSLEAFKLPVYTDVKLSLDTTMVKSVTLEDAKLIVTKEKEIKNQLSAMLEGSIILLISDKSVVTAIGSQKYIWEICESDLDKVVNCIIDRFVKTPIIVKISELLKNVMDTMNDEDKKTLNLATEIDPFLAISELPEIEVGHSITLGVEMIPEGTELPNLRIVAQNESIISIDGLSITALMPGTTNIDIYRAEENIPFVRKCVKTYQDNFVKKIELSLSAGKMGIGRKQEVNIALIPEDAEDINSVEWSVDNADVIRVSQDGVITALEDGVATITATTTKASSSISVKVLPNIRNIVSTVTQSHLYVGQTESISVLVEPNNCFDSSYEWKSSDKSVAIVDKLDDGQTVIRATGIGNCTLTCIAKEGGCSTTCNVLVESTFKKRENAHGMLSLTAILAVACIFCAALSPVLCVPVAIATVVCGVLAIARNKGDRFWAFILMAAAVLTALEATGITNWL